MSVNIGVKTDFKKTMLGLNRSPQPIGYGLYQLLKVQWGHLQQEGDDPSVLDGLLHLRDGASHSPEKLPHGLCNREPHLAKTSTVVDSQLDS